MWNAISAISQSLPLFPLGLLFAWVKKESILSIDIRMLIKKKKGLLNPHLKKEGLAVNSESLALSACYPRTCSVCSKGYVLFKDVGILFRLGSVRLCGGKRAFEGTVEVYENGVWGIICSSHWDDADASVVCHQLRLGWVCSTLTESVCWDLKGVLAPCRYLGEVTSCFSFSHIPHWLLAEDL